MWRKSALCAAGVAGVLVCAAFGQQPTSVTHEGEPHAQSTFHPGDDPQSVQLAARRVQRVLQVLGLSAAPQVTQPLPQTGAATNIPSSSAKLTVSDEDENETVGDAKSALLPLPTLPPLMGREKTPAVPINVLREPSPASFASHETSPGAPPSSQNSLRSTSPEAGPAAATPQATKGTAVIESRRRSAPPAEKGTMTEPADATRLSISDDSGEERQLAPSASPHELLARTTVLQPQPAQVAKQRLADRDALDRLPKLAADMELARVTLPPLARKPFAPAPPDLTTQTAAGHRHPTATRSELPLGSVLPWPSNTLRGRSLTIAADLPELLPSQQDQVRVRQGPPAEPALLHVAVRESRLLRTSENVVRVVSEHGQVCEVVQYNNREIALIGKQQGTAKVEFWYDRQGMNRASYLVAVGNGPSEEVQLDEGQRKIERLLAYLYPESRIELVRGRDGLIVRGSAVSQQQAVEMISTVRRSQLIPVVDEIAVQTR